MGRKKKTDVSTASPATVPKRPPGRPRVEITGTHGRLTVIGDDPDNKKNVIVQCSCGSPRKSVRKSNLLSGLTTSCGCARRERSRQTVAIATEAAQEVNSQPWSEERKQKARQTRAANLEGEE